MRKLVLTLLLIATSTTPVWCQPAARVSILVVPGLRAEDLTRPELPAIRDLVKRSAVGWMNTRTASRTSDSEESGYLTLGSGTRAAANPILGLFGHAQLAQLREMNANLDHPVPIGALGDILRAAGKTTMVVGGEDEAEPRSGALLLAIDSLGTVDSDHTFAGEWSRQADDEPFGFSTAFGAFELAREADLAVLVFGDLLRAGKYAPLCLPKVAAQQKIRALLRLNWQISAWSEHLQTDMNLLGILLAPTASSTASPGDRLAPKYLGRGFRHHRRGNSLATAIGRRYLRQATGSRDCETASSRSLRPCVR